MNNIFLKKLLPVLIMSVILIFDIIVIVFDVLSRNIGTAVFLAVMGAILTYRIAVSLIELKK